MADLKIDNKCLYCNKPINKLVEEKKYELIIPSDIAPKEGLELLYADRYKYQHNKFCDEKCYNLKVIDEAINHLQQSLMFPEEHFLPRHINDDIKNAEVTIKKLEQFKENLLIKN